MVCKFDAYTLAQIQKGPDDKYIVAVRIQGKPNDPSGLRFKMPDLSEKTALGKRIKKGAQGLGEKEIINICVGSSPMNDSISEAVTIEPIPEHMKEQLLRIYEIDIQQFMEPENDK